jgi:hypothetical protein
LTLTFESLQHLVGVGIHLLAVDEDALARPAAQEDVLGDVHVPAERKVLVDSTRCPRLRLSFGLLKWTGSAANEDSYRITA